MQRLTIYSLWEIIISILLIIGFLGPWFYFDFNGITVRGYEIGIMQNKFSFLQETIHLEDVSFTKAGILLYVIPAMAFLHITALSLRWKFRIFKADYLITAISVLITYIVAGNVDGTASSFFGWGLLLTAGAAITGLLSQLISFLYHALNSKT
ncbi:MULTISPECIES: hypothetical protein [Chitinophagaceae]